jgi:Caspase domain
MKKYQIVLPFLLLTACGTDPKPQYTPSANAPVSQNVSAQPRYALVIGNGKYNGRDVSILQNPAKDAALVSQSLMSIGFQVKTLTNLNRDALFEAVTQFCKLLKSNPKSVGLF